jgi:hypothetical protein
MQMAGGSPPERAISVGESVIHQKIEVGINQEVDFFP